MDERSEESRRALRSLAREIADTAAAGESIWNVFQFPTQQPTIDWAMLALAQEVEQLAAEQEDDRGRLAQMTKAMEHRPGSVEADRLELRLALREERARSIALEAQLRAELVEALLEVAATRRSAEREVAKLKAEIEEIKESHDAAGWDHAERSEMQADD